MPKEETSRTARKRSSKNNKNRLHYDALCKQLLAKKSVIAILLHESLVEFSKIPIDEIRDHCIENIVISGSDGIEEPFLANSGTSIIGDNTEISRIDFGTIRFDLKFSALYPTLGKWIPMIINIEAQAGQPAKYHLVTRGEYYTASMLVSEKGTIFENMDYQKLQKCQSIFICVNPLKSQRNTINSYRMTENQKVGNVVLDKSAYDLMEVTVINLGKKDEASDGILRFLEVLLSTTRPAEEKIKILTEEYGIEVNEIQMEVDEMCNIGQKIWEDAEQHGIEIGEQRGIEIGEQRGIEIGEQHGEKKLLTLISYLFNTNQSDQIAKVTEDEKLREEFYKKLGLA